MIPNQTQRRKYGLEKQKQKCCKLSITVMDKSLWLCKKRKKNQSIFWLQQITIEHWKNWNTTHRSSKLTNFPLSVVTGQNEIQLSKSVWTLVMIVSDKLLVSKMCQFTCTCLSRELVQLDMSSQLRWPKSWSHPWYHHVLTTVTLLFVRNAQTDHWQTLKGSQLFCQTHFRDLSLCFTTPLLAKLYWLPVALRTEYKVSSTCYDIVSKTAPPYLSDLLHLYIPFHSLQSSADTCTVLDSKMKEKVQKSTQFSPSAPSHGINFPSLYAMLQQNPSSRHNSN